MELEKLGLTPRVYNALRRAHIDTVEQLLAIPPDELRGIKDIGVLAESEINSCIDEMGLRLNRKTEKPFDLLKNPTRAALKLEEIRLDFFELVICPTDMTANLRFAINGSSATATFPVNTSMLHEMVEALSKDRGLML